MAPPHHARTEIGDVKAPDVLKGRGLKNHPGNVYYRQLISENCARYQECSSRGDCRDEMNQIVQSIIDQVHAAGGRFIDKNYKGWVELAPKEQREKVARSLKDAKKVDSSSAATSSNPRDHHGGENFCSAPTEQVQPTPLPGSIHIDQHSKTQASFPSVLQGMLPTTYFGDTDSGQSLQLMSEPFVAQQAEPLCFAPNIGTQTSTPFTNRMPNDSTVQIDGSNFVDGAHGLPVSLNVPPQTGPLITDPGIGGMELSPNPIDPRQTNVGNNVPVSVEDQKIAPISEMGSTPSASGQLDGGPKETEKDKTDSKILEKNPANDPAEDSMKCAATSFTTNGASSQEAQNARETTADSSYINAAATGELEYSCGSLSLGSGSSAIRRVERECEIRRVGVNNGTAASAPSGDNKSANVESAARASMESSIQSSLLSAMDFSGISLDMMASLNMSESMNMSLDFGVAVGEPLHEVLERADSNRTLPTSNKRRSENNDSILSDVITNMLQEDSELMQEEKQLDDPPAEVARSPSAQPPQQHQQPPTNNLLRTTCRSDTIPTCTTTTSCQSSPVASLHSSVSTEGSLVDSK